MKRTLSLLCLTALVLSVGLVLPARAAQVWISDILAQPQRYWNTTVTVVGQVQAVAANPAGTTRGAYTLLDDSCPNPLTIRTTDLPPVGRNYSVTGTIIQDPANANAPLMKEISRQEPGMSSMIKYILIGAAAVFLILIIILIVVLAKPKQKAPAMETIRPMSPPSGPAPDLGRTTKIPPSATMPAAAPSGGGRTQVFVSLGADIVVDKGPDKGKEFTLHKQVTSIGRPGSRKNDIELNDDTVSKEQSSVYYDGSKKEFSIANESMTNPTKVNGQSISGPIVLDNEAVIEMGRSVLRFRKQ
jgi:hypothetical protein